MSLACRLHIKYKLHTYTRLTVRIRNGWTTDFEKSTRHRTIFSKYSDVVDTLLVHSAAPNGCNNLSSQFADNHHCLDAVYWRREVQGIKSGGRASSPAAPGQDGGVYIKDFVVNFLNCCYHCIFPPFMNVRLLMKSL